MGNPGIIFSLDFFPWVYFMGFFLQAPRIPREHQLNTMGPTVLGEKTLILKHVAKPAPWKSWWPLPIQIGEEKRWLWITLAWNFINTDLCKMKCFRECNNNHFQKCHPTKITCLENNQVPRLISRKNETLKTQQSSCLLPKGTFRNVFQLVG